MLRPAEECFWSLYRYIDELLWTHFRDAATARYVRLLFLSSAFKSLSSVPNLDCTADRDEAITENLNVIVLWRVPAPKRFYGSTHGRFKTVRFYKESNKKHKNEYNNCSFANVIRLVEFHEKSAALFCFELYGQKGCKSRNQNSENGFHFVQWYESLNNIVLPVDIIDKDLNSMQLWWQRTSGEAKKYRASKEFVLVPFESIRAVVHSVLRDKSFSAIESNICYKMKFGNLTKGSFSREWIRFSSTTFIDQILISFTWSKFRVSL